MLINVNIRTCASSSGIMCLVMVMMMMTVVMTVVTATASTSLFPLGYSYSTGFGEYTTYKQGGTIFANTRSDKIVVIDVSRFPDITIKTSITYDTYNDTSASTGSGNGFGRVLALLGDIGRYCCVLWLFVWLYCRW